MTPGRLVLLNGPPSSGKTTLARALQEALDGPWFHHSLDDFRRGYRPEHWFDDDGTLFARVLVGYLGALRAMVLGGNEVIAEAVITPSRAATYVEAFDGVPVTLVGVRCPLEVALERERQRTDRRHGLVELGADEFASVHHAVAYDLEADTSLAPASELAATLAPQIRGVVPTAFARL